MRHPTQRDVGEAGFVFRIATADIGVVSGESRLLQPIRMLQISRKRCPHIQRESGPLSALLHRLSVLRLNARNLTLRAATECLLGLRIHFGTRFALFAHHH